jgi:pyrimidine operon attenuation protein/uracil phosphoribosyltransferase
VSKLTSAAGPSRVDGPLARPIEGASAPPGGSEVREATSVGALMLDAEALYGELLRGVQLISHPSTRLVGVTSGGAWLAERLQRDLKLPGTAGTISSSMHRDDFAQRGLSAGGQTVLPFDVNGADILLLDDVLYTGRTLRAVINELFDYGRPARVRLAVLVDRGGRELPVQADFAAARVALAADQSLALARSDAGVFSFKVEDVS